MLCQTCQYVPLELFLPTQVHRRGVRDSRGWMGRILWYPDIPGLPTALEKLAMSAAEGCEFCQTLQFALADAEPSIFNTPAIQANNPGLNLGAEIGRSSDETFVRGENGIVLTLPEEGVVNVIDGKRVGKLSWSTPSMGLGFPRTYSLAEFPLDPTVTQQCRTWLEGCVQDHGACRRSQDLALPAYLVEIDGNGAGFKTRLVSTASQAGTIHQYTALSYCRGERNGSVATTTGNLSSRLSEIPRTDLCQTFLDAIRFTTKLGLKHIWIDALCIPQDDFSSKSIESSQMSSIYGGAYVTLAASDASDGTQGFLQPRNPLIVHGVKLAAKNNRWSVNPGSIMSGIIGRFPNNPDVADVSVYPAFRPWLKAIQGPLTKRAWALQERELSTRVIHFTANRVLWECRQCFAAEDVPEVQNKKEFNDTNLWTASPLRALDPRNIDKPQELSHVTETWTTIVQDYSRRNLSDPMDRSVALAGIAKEFALHAKGDTYLAGNWHLRLLEALAWFPDESMVKAEGSAAPQTGVISTQWGSDQNQQWPPAQLDAGSPTWSWTSYNNAVWFFGAGYFAGRWGNITLENGETKYVKINESIKVLGAAVTPKDYRYGPTSKGSVNVSGFGLQLDVSEHNHDTDLGQHWLRKIYHVRLNPNPSTMVLESQRRRAFELAGMEKYASLVAAEPQAQEPMSSQIASFYLYFDHDPKTLPAGQYLCLKLGSGKPPRGGKPDRDVGLVLIRSKTSPEAYQRVGMFDVASNEEIWKTKRSEMELSIV